MAEWGRKEYSKAWPSRTHVWTWTAIFLVGIFFFGVFCLDYWHGWTAVERLYLTDYLKSGVRGKASPSATAKYTLLEAVVGKGQRLVIDNEVEPVTGPDGRLGYGRTAKRPLRPSDAGGEVMARVKRASVMDKPLAPTQFAALLFEHITALRGRDYSENTIRCQHVHVRYFLEWCAERGLNSGLQRGSSGGGKTHTRKLRCSGGKPLESDWLPVTAYVVADNVVTRFNIR